MVVVCKKKKKPHPAWVFLRKMPEKQLILFAWPKSGSPTTDPYKEYLNVIHCINDFSIRDISAEPLTVF